MRKLFLRNFLPIIIIYLFFNLSGCSKEGKGYETIKASGFIEAREIDIRSEVNGKIIKLDFEEGDRFKEGDILCLIDKEKLELQLKQAESYAKETAAKLSLLRRGLRREEVDRAKIFVDELREK